MPGLLVVDDEPAIRLLCRVNLQADGFAVKEAPGRGRARARAWKPDLILLDVMMPGARAVRGRQRRSATIRGPAAAIVFLTARADMGDKEASAAGAPSVTSRSRSTPRARPDAAPHRRRRLAGPAPQPDG